MTNEIFRQHLCLFNVVSFGRSTYGIQTLDLIKVAQCFCFTMLYRAVIYCVVPMCSRADCESRALQMYKNLITSNVTTWASVNQLEE